MICERCKKKVLTREEFAAELSKLGCRVGSDGNISMSGAFYGYGGIQLTQDKIAKLESDKAIKCKSCGKIYCVDCLSRYAPMHRTSGGKACFSCGGSLQEV